jgi:dienelactone hydrolase
VKLKVTLCLGLVALLALLGALSPAASRRSTAVRVLHLVDRSRTIRMPNGRQAPRPVTTYVRVPASGTGPWPLIVFGHGYAVTPGIYARLLQAWVRAGYVVAAPLFPLGNKHAAGGPDESDIVNQPRDLSFVISQLLAASASPGNPLHGLIDGSHIAVAGQSDGGETALAATYDPPYRDARIDAAVILSGAQLSGDSVRFPKTGVPLLAAQGTADRINLPSYTYGFYDAARRPKFLLTLLGAGHLEPYTSQQPQLGVVERVTTAFLDRYLKQGSAHAIFAAGSVRGVAQLSARP